MTHTITTRPITVEEHERVGNPVERQLDAIFGEARPPANKPGVAERIAAGSVHSMLLGAEMDGELVCAARLEKDDAGWRIERAFVPGIERGDIMRLDAQLLTALALACPRAGVRAFYEQARKNSAETFAPRTYVDERAGETDLLRAAGLTADAPHRLLQFHIAAVRSRGALVPATGWETLAADNLPARVRAYRPETHEHLRYRLSAAGTVTCVRLRTKGPDPRLVGMGGLTWLHGPHEVGVEATRDALAQLVEWGATSLWVHKPLAASLVRDAPTDLVIDPDERERVRWWTSPSVAG